MHVYYVKLAPNPIANLFKRNDDLHQYRTRRRLDPCVELFRTSIARKSFVYMGTSLWSKIHKDYCDIEDTKIFVKKYKRYLLGKYSNI